MDINEKVNRKIQKNKTSRSKTSRIKSRKYVVILLILFVLISFLYMSTTIKKITINGCNFYTEEQMEDLLFISPFDNNALIFYLKNKYETNHNIPFVQAIDVELDDRNSVTVNVYEKTIIGCVEYLGENMYFDKDGIIVEASTKKLKHIPYISGLEFNKIILHEKLEVQKDEMFDIILNLTLLIEKYELDIETIAFNQYNEVTLITDDIRVEMGSHEFYDDAIAQLKNMLAKAKEENLKGTFNMQNYHDGQDTFYFREKDS